MIDIIWAITPTLAGHLPFREYVGFSLDSGGCRTVSRNNYKDIIEYLRINIGNGSPAAIRVLKNRRQL